MFNAREITVENGYFSDLKIHSLSLPRYESVLRKTLKDVSLVDTLNTGFVPSKRCVVTLREPAKKTSRKLTPFPIEYTGLKKS